VQLPDGGTLHFGHAADGEPRASMRLRNWNVCAAALRSGDIGFAESFIAGDWTSPDLVALLQAVHRQPRRDRVGGLRHVVGLAALPRAHLFNRNSRKGSKKNIHAHYDLGNEFYRLWLDPTMNYSSAWFDGDRSGSRWSTRSGRRCGAHWPNAM
jgi:cyclopropane-fatty-acyl-phospholipid synthase